ncbi:unnamed protein product [Paramecium pentaurelia]|uniref:RING-type domain-containing protein n=1 Tax=Paramecium pentaurelia TaxID=43138 RepID=A0A8S1YBP8_9CILI|nr:unnamed protein product [Paramecium pentaurelia]
MKSKTIFYVGAIVGIYYFTKSAVKQLLKFKSLLGERSSINYLFKKIEKQNQEQNGLQFFTQMYIAGSPQRIVSLCESNPNLKTFFLISQIKLRQGQDSFFSSNIVERSPIFSLKNAYDLEVQINALNQFSFNLEKARIMFQEEMSVYRALLFNLNLMKREIIAGLPYNKQYLIFGDFIHNPKTKVLRCYRIRKLTEIKDYPYLRFQFYFSNIISILLKIGLVASLSYFLYNSAKKILYQDINIKDVLVSQYHQTLSCFICKERRANIIYEPCFHLSCCMECSQNKVNCPVCQKNILRQIKVFNE